MSVQTVHLRGGGERGLWKSTFFPYTFTFLAWFLLFSWGFLALKKCWYVLFFWGEGVSESVHTYNHENVDIYGWPHTVLNVTLVTCFLCISTIQYRLLVLHRYGFQTARCIGYLPYTQMSTFGRWQHCLLLQYIQCSILSMSKQHYFTSAEHFILNISCWL